MSLSEAERIWITTEDGVSLATQLDKINNNNNFRIGAVTDDKRNMDVVVREAGLPPRIKCLTHTF